jgi:UPF0716 family protein affecting phage T7 exclusion
MPSLYSVYGVLNQMPITLFLNVAAVVGTGWAVVLLEYSPYVSLVLTFGAGVVVTITSQYAIARDKTGDE